MAKPISKIAPLREDLARIVPDCFLVTTEFKRWLVQVGINEVWDRCLSYAKSQNSVFVLGDDGSLGTPS